MRHAVARLTPRWLIRLGAAASAADLATQRKLQAVADRLTPQWWRRLNAAGSEADLAIQRKACSVAARLTPGWWPGLRAAAAAFAARPLVRRSVLALALLLAIAAYVRALLPIYRGDAYNYWLDIRQPDLYITAISPDRAPHGYLYSPAFIQAIWPLLSLPWEVFYCIWLGLLTAVLLWLARPWLACLIFPLVFVTFGITLLMAPRHSLSSGNIEILMTLAVVAGFRRPWTYAFLLLTKVTPGIGLLWFLVRREWRNLTIALVATAAVFLVSFSFSANLWFDWATVIRNNSTYPEPAFAFHILPLIPRLIIAAVLIAVAAHYNARWVVPIAILIALPYIAETGPILLVGVFALLRHDRWTEPREAKPAPSPA